MREIRRNSTLVRIREVLAAYEEVTGELGELARVVSKSYIYGRIQERTGLCIKTIAYIINHLR